MRISDWSSDVCSSDLEQLNDGGDQFHDGLSHLDHRQQGNSVPRDRSQGPPHRFRDATTDMPSVPQQPGVWAFLRRTSHRICLQTNLEPNCSRPDRKSFVSGKSVSLRLDFGVRRIIKKKTLLIDNNQPHTPTSTLITP